jgi:hypothetical protein
LYPEEKRTALSVRRDGAFPPQSFAGVLDSVGRETRSILGGDRHKQSPLPFEFDRERSGSDSDFAVLPTNIKRHPWLYSGLAANIFGNHQSASVVNGRFHGMKITIILTVCQSKTKIRHCRRLLVVFI